MSSYTGPRLRFGTFLSPYHRVGTNPTLAFERNLQLITYLEEFGYDEAWIGEHHSGGLSLNASPEVFIAAAAERTSRIRLGTGVASLPYHNPFHTAARIRQLDHMTRGRTMLGVGPGQLVKDAEMIGIDSSLLRVRMEEALNVILPLLRGETVTAKTDWFELRDAVLQLPAYSDVEVAVTAVVSPAGPRLAGRNGISLLSVAATNPQGIEKLAEHWEIVQAEAATFGQNVSKATWRLMGPMHVADSVEQAAKDMEYGLHAIFSYFNKVTPGQPAFDTTREFVDFINDSGYGVIGTPEMARQQLLRLTEKSGGFGTYLFMGADFADPVATRRSYQIFAEEVMPEFQGQSQASERSWAELVGSDFRTAKATGAAQAAAAERYRNERASREAAASAPV
ncbi:MULTISPECIES: LLM class flavin-dependent oxidoreductase [unclassified Microbacterium]|uniref:LLM class flavin-dependent oxidoreductase n=1 Tax=unclassified Microbacterium TaxID=2609290 RepID=UPI000C2C4FB4|nr:MULTISPECIES: LLM class flavin-dependent oxidoreductase [unclassified Microbacterium]